MLTNSSICRIGVFYDGSFFAYAQRYLYRERQLGWLSFQPLHAFFEYKDNQGKKSFINERLLNSCNYAMDIMKLENDKDFRNSFKGLFRKQSDWE